MRCALPLLERSGIEATAVRGRRVWTRAAVGPSNRVADVHGDRSRGEPEVGDRNARIAGGMGECTADDRRTHPLGPAIALRSYCSPAGMSGDGGHRLSDDDGQATPLHGGTRHHPHADAMATWSDEACRRAWHGPGVQGVIATPVQVPAVVHTTRRGAADEPKLHPLPEHRLCRDRDQPQRRGGGDPPETYGFPNRRGPPVRPEPRPLRVGGGAPGRAPVCPRHAAAVQPAPPGMVHRQRHQHHR
jgi:hypothetical protein